MEKEVLRMCIATRKMFPREQLIRIVSCNGLVTIDINGKTFGRGAYLSKSKEALEIVKKKNAISRALKTPVSTEIYNELERLING